MSQSYFPRILFKMLVILMITGYGTIRVLGPRSDTKFSALYRLLEWREPSTGELLDLPVNRDTRVTDQIHELGAATELYLGGSQLTVIPPEIGQLTNLEGLFLVNNQLTALPSEIGQLRKLEALALWNNQLMTLSPEIGRLTNLERLGLWGTI